MCQPMLEAFMPIIVFALIFGLALLITVAAIFIARLLPS